jgi:glutamate synthase domain-containing protein 1/glutamate synthase domain-containing protein 3
MKTDRNDMIHRIVGSRKQMADPYGVRKKPAEEGGCGVTGFISSVPVSGRHIYEPSTQMHNRGNGKGGGIAAIGLSAECLGVSQEVLDTHYMLQVALLDPDARGEVETANIAPFLDVHKMDNLATIDDYRDIEGLEVKPPDVCRYFVRVKSDALDRFITENKLQELSPEKAEDEFIFQNTADLNQKFYASLGDQRAFVLSHAKNLMILKIVGYAEKVVQYYRLQDFKAHGWIAHQRYPTKGRVWHPGGAHPFNGVDEALVHNGDFANYHAVSEYLKQYRIYPQFLTDTEVSVQLFDLWSRTFNYPVEYIIEAMAPTTEYDFDRLPLEKRRIYQYIQSAHMQASPDGPWFFIIARNDRREKQFQLLGITDTSMLRPQVFALQDGQVQIGLICSEKQAIDATLQSLANEDDRFCPVADVYWNARGGSASDGGTFIFSVKDSAKGDGTKNLVCTNKFGDVVSVSPGQVHDDVTAGKAAPDASDDIFNILDEFFPEKADDLLNECLTRMSDWSFETLKYVCRKLVAKAKKDDGNKHVAIHVLTRLNDLRYGTGIKKRSAVLSILRRFLTEIFSGTPTLDQRIHGIYGYIDWASRSGLRPPAADETILVLNAKEFPPEGEDCDARLICEAYQLGWKRFICFGYRGQRFTGCGLSSDSTGVRIDVYDSSGDYVGSGIDGLEIHIHGNAQDQLGQIMKQGKLVIYGDVGQTFMYGAKGGEVYVMGNAAGRPLINAVGRPRVVINGTCLDFLAESFMAGDPLSGGGFVIVNGLEFDIDGQLVEQGSAYPGSNLFSLASGGAIYIRDPHRTVVAEQLNGGEIVPMTPEDWHLILPYLEENEKLFNISIEKDLLVVGGRKMHYKDVYRKVQPAKAGLIGKAPVAVEEWGEDWQAA